MRADGLVPVDSPALIVAMPTLSSADVLEAVLDDLAYNLHLYCQQLSS